jgi:hypothetical protein
MAVEYYPTSSQFIVTGIVGLCLYVLILYLSTRSIIDGFKSKSTKRFFLSISLMSLLELPRFFALAITGQYTSKTCYCFHMMAGIFFFLGFSIVCRQWSGLLQLGTYFRMVYGYHGLIVFNVVFAVIDFIGMIFCARSISLEAFFDSLPFVVITLIEAIRNLIYSSFLSYYGLRLVRRFWHFSRLERQTNRNWSCCSFSHEHVFTKVVFRLTTVLLLTTMCFIFRLTMLSVKMAELHTEEVFTSPIFPIFGLLWFTFSDFIPRALPSLAFIFLMRTKKPAKHQLNQGVNNPIKGSDANAFQFVRFETDRDDDHNNNNNNHHHHPAQQPHRSYSFTTFDDDDDEIAFDRDSTVQNILQHDQFVEDHRHGESNNTLHQMERSTLGISLVSFRDLQIAAQHQQQQNQQLQFQQQIEANNSNNSNNNNINSFENELRENDLRHADDDGEGDDEDDVDIGVKALDTLMSLLQFTGSNSKDDNLLLK